MTTVADFHQHGFDVSHWQPSAPDFTQGGRTFAIIKATEGTTDPHFVANRDAAHAQGLAAVGLYHFARPASDVHEQVDRFVKAVGSRRDREFFVLDYEKDPWSEAWAVTWLNAVRDRLGGPVVFYTYRDMLTAHPHEQIKATGAALWCASYSSKPPDTGSWAWTFWQHTDGQDKVSGNNGPYDCSVFHSNDPNDLAAFVGAQPGDEELTGEEHRWLNEIAARVDRIRSTLGIKDADPAVSPVLDDINTKLDDLATGHIDYDKLAKAVNDDAAKRRQNWT